MSDQLKCRDHGCAMFDPCMRGAYKGEFGDFKQKPRDVGCDDYMPNIVVTYYFKVEWPETGYFSMNNSSFESMAAMARNSVLMRDGRKKFDGDQKVIVTRVDGNGKELGESRTYIVEIERTAIFRVRSIDPSGLE